MYLQNKYTHVYNNIIERAKSRTISGYTENHHIIPRSLGGSDNTTNLAALTAREHYICHLLLPKMLEGEGKYKMLCAILRMAHSNQEQRVKIPSRVYERVKIEKAFMHSQLYSGENNPFYGRKHSEETKQKIREARAKQLERDGNMTATARAKLSAAAKGRELSKTHKDKISRATKQAWKSDILREAVSERFAGKAKSEEHKQKLREASKAKASKEPKPQITCPHCGKTGGAPTMKRWHLDNCKNK
jgi:hypothetical protein